MNGWRARHIDVTTTLLDRLGLHRPVLRAWAMYDWANSAFSTTIVTAVFPDFYSSVAGANLPPATATARFAAATTIAVVLVAMMGPVLGAIADRAGLKKRLLGVFAALGVVATAAMVFIEAGDWRLASVLFILGNIGFSGSIVFYDSLLPHIAAAEEMDRVSAAGFALGYLGGGLLLAVNLAWILTPATFGIPGTLAAIRLSFLSVAVWWAVFSISLFRTVPEPPRSTRPAASRRGPGADIRQAFVGLRTTLQELRTYRQAFLMLLAFLLYNDGIQTIIRMASIYGAEIGIDRNARILAFVLVQFIGIPFSFLFGMLAERIGAIRSIFLALAAYTGISVLGYFMSSTREFFILAGLVAMVQGGSQALSRSLFASLIPRQKSSEYFGFFSVFEKIAGVLGPALFAATIAMTGSSRGAVLSVVFFFATGGLVLSRVDVGEGRRAARQAEFTA